MKVKYLNHLRRFRLSGIRSWRGTLLGVVLWELRLGAICYNDC
jgi:hypothetical protein